MRTLKIDEPIMEKTVAELNAARSEDARLTSMRTR